MMKNWTLEQTLEYLRSRGELDPLTEQGLRESDAYMKAHPEEADEPHEGLMELAARLEHERKQKK